MIVEYADHYGISIRETHQCITNSIHNSLSLIFRDLSAY